MKAWEQKRLVGEKKMGIGNPCGGGNPCAEKNPCAAKNPCAVKKKKADI
jgi:hypothetical protein